MSAVFDRAAIVGATDLAGLADELLGPRRGRGRSGSWPCPSPHHAQTGRTPPVSVFRARTGEERWHCHGCGIGGTAVDLVMATTGVGVGQGLEALARRLGRRPGELPDPPPRPARPASSASGDPAGLAAFVEDCAARLWRPEGAAVWGWLTGERGLPAEVLRANRLGADPGRAGQPRPDGMPAAGPAAVLPVLVEGRPVFAQLRAVRPLPGRPRYLNAAGRLAPNPRLGLFQPAQPRGRCVLVTEGILDALSANAAGFRAAAVLGASLAGGEAAGAEVAARLARLGAPLVLAFDADEAGDRAAAALRHRLRERGSDSAVLRVPGPAKDLNAWMLGSRDWPRSLGAAVRTAFLTRPLPRRLSR